MLETGGDNVKRLVPFRNRPTNRRNSRDRLDRVNSLGDNGGGSVVESRVNSGLGITPGGPISTVAVFSCNEAARIMSERWATTISAVNNPSVDPADRPVVYSSMEGGLVWGSSTLPHLWKPEDSVPDFLLELNRAVLKSTRTPPRTTPVFEANRTGYTKAEAGTGGYN